MTNTIKKIKHKITASFLLMLTITSVLFVIPLFSENSENNYNNNDETDITQDFIFPAISAGIGDAPWWNVSYQWRQCINITNPGDYNVTDNFDMDLDLFDVRIVENNEVRNYYVKKDFPSNGFATIWFETNSTLAISEYDTYMY